LGAQYSASEGKWLCRPLPEAQKKERTVRIAFIGGGVMGEVIIKGILSQGLARPQDITASDIDMERLSALSQGYGIKTSANNRQAMEGAEVVVLAIKPQNLKEVLEGIRGPAQEQLILSIVAGASIAAIVKGLGHNLIVRAMPNTPAQIGEGITVWTASDEVSQGQKEMAQSILGALGKEIYVSDEKYLDMATAVSGSGPAYIFLVIEALVDAAVHIGWPREKAEELVLQTILGATRLVQATGKQPAELRKMVTSPGGTTEEALLQLEQGGLRALIDRAVIAAYEKAKGLGGK
jgi:pyrroline-5-carboxylate reductase